MLILLTNLQTVYINRYTNPTTENNVKITENKYRPALLVTMHKILLYPHLSRMDVPTLISRTGPFTILADGREGQVSPPKFDTTDCTQTVKSLIKRHIIRWGGERVGRSIHHIREGREAPKGGLIFRVWLDWGGVIARMWEGIHSTCLERGLCLSRQRLVNIKPLKCHL